MDKKQMLIELDNYYALNKGTNLATILEISPQVFSNWKSRNSFDAELIYTKCLTVNPEWLLTGRGEMLKRNPSIVKSSNDLNSIPLIPVEAMAGYGGGEMQIMEYEAERFIVPTFKGADYLIGVRGSSMYPKYNSGDIVACKHLPIDTFFQWNKVYVLDTIQGPLIKRVCKGNDDDHILIVSDNSKYDPFQLHRSELNAIAIVMGVIRLE